MSKLFQPLQIGQVKLQHRVVMAPLTRMRVSEQHAQLPIVQEYYAQRSSEPGTLLISEGLIVSARLGGYTNMPALYNDEQTEAWKPITSAIHANGSFIYAQLAGLGRAEIPTEENGKKILGPSAIPMHDNSPTPVAMTEAEIEDSIENFVQSAKRAIEAGFDGIELHGANGFLIDQFTQENSNQRTDKWGGSIENRSRFALEITKRVAAVVGADKTAFRISPFSTYQAMRMKDPIPQFSYLTKELSKLGLAYLHVVEARIAGAVDSSNDEELDFLVDIWGKTSPVLIAGGHTPESAKKLVDETFKDSQVAVVFGRHFISNPDLPYKIKNGVKLTPYDRSTFYSVGSSVGYTDYPFSPEYEASRIKTAA